MDESRTDVERPVLARLELSPPTLPSDPVTLDRLLTQLESATLLDTDTLVHTLADLCERRLALGVGPDAEAFASRAVTLARQRLGDEHSDIVILLNDLTRTFLRQQAFGAAEPLVLQLLALKRAKGEDHAEVATVLATLATIRQELGRHEAAEELWRRVLAIRERTLAPNHFAIATALERLGESCAARGKLGQSLAYLRRGQSIREVTLGADHPSLRAVRERIADLELQTEELEDEDLHAPEPAPMPSLTLSRVRETPAEPLHAPALTESEVLPVASSLAPVQPPAMVANTGEVAYAEALLAVQRELEADAERERAARQAGALAFWRRWRDRGVLPKAALLLLLALILGPIWWRSELDGSPEDQYAATPRTLPPSASVPSAAPLSAAPVAAAHTPPSVVTSRALAPMHVTAPSPRRGLSAMPAEATATVTIPRLAPSVLARADSAIHGVALPDRAASDVVLNLTPSAGAITLPTVSRDAAPPPLRARVAGPVPSPRYPEALARSGIGGEVRVRFTVDAEGQPAMSTFEVVRSPHPQLSASVRDVVARTRFEPARSAVDGRNQPDEVEMSFQFERPDD